MSYAKNSNVEKQHAIFPPSQSAWLRYDDEKVIEVYRNKKAAEMGTLLHAWAEDTINLGIKQPRSNKTLYMYVNDAIGYHMETEKKLYYSDLFFGTADAICFRNNLLRIHDLKTGVKQAHMEQLEVYAALFCLQEKIDPIKINMELRIYQNNEVVVHNPDPLEIQAIMGKIIHITQLISEIE